MKKQKKHLHVKYVENRIPHIDPYAARRGIGGSFYPAKIEIPGGMT